MSTLQRGAEKATDISETTLEEVKNKLGLNLHLHRAKEIINSNS